MKRSAEEISWTFGPQRKERDEDISILRVTHFSPIATKKEAVDRIANSLSQGVRNQDTGFVLRASRSDAKKTIFKKDLFSPVLLAILEKIQELATTSVLIESHADILHENRSVQGIHVFASPVLLKEKLYRIELTVRDYVETGHERKMVHSINGVEIYEFNKAKTFVWESPAQEMSTNDTLLKAGQPTNERTPIIQNRDASIKLSQLLTGYIRADGHRYFDSIEQVEYEVGGAYYSEVREKYVNRVLFEEFLGLYRKSFEKSGAKLNSINRESLLTNFEILAKPLWHSPNQPTPDKAGLYRILCARVYSKHTGYVEALKERLCEPPKTINPNKGELER